MKKPKLDRHYGQCRSSFTCIDCSKTFAAPIEWKGHTSCITEAEKYQKSVYKGSKKVRRNSSSPPHSPIGLQGQDSRPGNGHQDNIQLITTNAPGKYRQSRSNQSSWSRNPYIRNCASGANTTPLGSPLRMSPADTSAVEPFASGTNAATKTEHGEGKKRDSDVCIYARQTTLANSRFRRNLRRMEWSRKRGRGRRNTTLPENITGNTHRQMKRPMLHLNTPRRRLPELTDLPRDTKGVKIAEMILDLRPNPRRKVFLKYWQTRRSGRGKRRKKKRLG